MDLKNKELKNNGYIFVDNFISPDETKVLYDKFKDDYDKHPNEFSYDQQAPTSPAQYCSYMFLDVLIKKIPFVSEVIEEDVYPTYCYARHYKNGADLKPHTDRPACEISVSVHLGGDGTPWDLFFKKPNGEVSGINLTPGQGVIYRGCEVSHWREVFTGQEYGQVFLHYVRAKGENRWACFDRRK
jgi:hypothetical protein